MIPDRRHPDGLDLSMQLSDRFRGQTKLSKVGKANQLPQQQGAVHLPRRRIAH